MNGDRFLIDTNILLYLTGKKIDIEDLPEGEFYISFVTELEVLSYPSLLPVEEKDLKRLLAEIPIIDINKKIKERTIDFRRRYNLKLPDAIIGATACVLGTSLITNDEGFLSVKEIQIKSISL